MNKPQPVPDIEEGQPPHHVLKAWTQFEITTGEPISREEMAQVASLVVTYHSAVVYGVSPETADAVKHLVRLLYDNGHADYLREIIGVKVQ